MRRRNTSSLGGEDTEECPGTCAFAHCAETVTIRKQMLLCCMLLAAALARLLREIAGVVCQHEVRHLRPDNLPVARRVVEVDPSEEPRGAALGLHLRERERSRGEDAAGERGAREAEAVVAAARGASVLWDLCWGGAVARAQRQTAGQAPRRLGGEALIVRRSIIMCCFLGWSRGAEQKMDARLSWRRSIRRRRTAPSRRPRSPRSALRRSEQEGRTVSERQRQHSQQRETTTKGAGRSSAQQTRKMSQLWVHGEEECTAGGCALLGYSGCPGFTSSDVQRYPAPPLSGPVEVLSPRRSAVSGRQLRYLR